MNRADARPVHGPILQQALLKTALLLRYLATLLTVILYAALAPWGYAAFAVLVLLPVSASRRAAILQRCMRLGFTLLHNWASFFRLVDFRIALDPDALSKTPCVVVANHPSLLDVTVILRHVRSGCILVKPQLARHRWLRPLLEGSGQLWSASNPVEASMVVDRAVERIRKGATVVIFPEGTRTVPGRKMPFHRMAFEIACRAGVPVVPLKIRCDPSYLSKTRPLLRLQPHVPVLSVSMLSPVDPRTFESDSRRLCEHVRTLYTTEAAANR